MVRVLLTLAFLLLCCVGALAIALRLRPRPFALAPPLALATLVVFEGIALPSLSLLGAVTVPGLVVAHLPLIAAGGWGLSRAWSAVRRGSRLSRTIPPRLALVALAPIAAVLVVTLFRYPPTTWDSMTYHLARVAHWLDEASVFQFSSWIPRQNLFPPGAEYLLLVPQALSGTDRLAGLSQFLCWILAVLAAPSLARLFGAPRSLAAVAAVVVGTLPMAVLQATSTQNDLVASVAAMALLSTALPLAHGRPLRLGAAMALGIAVAAAWLVKPTALVAVAPAVAWAAVAGVRRRRASLALSWGAAAVPVLVVVAFEAVRRRPYGFPLLEPFYYYPLAGEWIDRAAHSVRALGHHLSVGELLGGLSPYFVSLRGAGLGQGAQPFRPSEDYVGNGMQAALFLAALGTAAWRWRRIPPRARAGVLVPLAGWFLLHALARENAWFSRLELPLFVLGITAMGSLHGLRERATFPHARLARAVTLPLAVFAVLIAAANEQKPLLGGETDPEVARYVARPAVKVLDDATLAVARERSCRRVGVRFSEAAYDDPWEYPLHRRARAEGIAMRHVQGGEDWPCVVLSPGEPPDPPRQGRWERLPESDVYWRETPATPR
jgi:hypothetical protein